MEFDAITVFTAFFVLVVFALIKVWLDERQDLVERLVVERQGRLDERQGRLDERQGRLDERQGRMRSEFRDMVRTFTDRDQMLNYLKEANFSGSKAKTELPNQGTADFFSKSSSEISVAGKIKLSSFRRSLLEGARPKMETYYWKLDSVGIRNILLEKVFLDKKVMETFLTEESRCLIMLRDALNWHIVKNRCLAKTYCQIAFQVYLQGLLDALAQRTKVAPLEVSPANKIHLHCKVKFNRTTEELTGYPDLIVRKKERTAGGEMVFIGNEVIGEVKLFGGALEQPAKRNAARDQLLGESFTMCNMCVRSGGLTPCRAFLTDVMRVMISICFHDRATQTYKLALSSAIQEPEDYICYLLLIFVMDLDEAFIDHILTSLDEPVPIDADDNSADKLSQGSTVCDSEAAKPERLAFAETKKPQCGQTGRRRALQVFDLNADDREAEKEDQLRVIYEHDALCKGYILLTEENLRNRRTVED